jgi:hypothetical protein
VAYHNGQGTIYPLDDAGWDRNEPVPFASSAELTEKLAKVGLSVESARLLASELREAWDDRYGRSYRLEAGHVLWMAGVISSAPRTSSRRARTESAEIDAPPSLSEAAR